MTTTSSIRSAWPGPPRHRHRRVAPPRWRGARRVLLSLLALVAGILALNGVIQATSSPARTSSGKDVDIASLLPPAAAAAEPPAEGGPAEAGGNSGRADPARAHPVLPQLRARPVLAVPPTPRPTARTLSRPNTAVIGTQRAGSAAAPSTP